MFPSEILQKFMNGKSTVYFWSEISPKARILVPIEIRDIFALPFSKNELT